MQLHYNIFFGLFFALIHNFYTLLLLWNGLNHYKDLPGCCIPRIYILFCSLHSTCWPCDKKSERNNKMNRKVEKHKSKCRQEKKKAHKKRKQQDVWMVSLTQWTWVWENSGRWWKTGKPDVLQSLKSQRVGYDWVTKQQFSPEPIHPLTIHWNFSCKVHQWLYSAKSNDPHINPSISLYSSSAASLNFFLHLASATQSTLAFTLITHWSLFSTFLTCSFSFLQPLKVDVLQGSLEPFSLSFAFTQVLSLKIILIPMRTSIISSTWMSCCSISTVTANLICPFQTPLFLSAPELDFTFGKWQLQSPSSLGQKLWSPWLFSFIPHI